MKWLREDVSGVSIDTREWAEAIKDVEDLEKMTALGKKVYRDCLRTAKVERDDDMDAALMAFAHILHHMMDNMDNDMWADMRWTIEGEWHFRERSFWESPEAVMKSFAGRDADGQAIVDLERIGHDLLYLIRPDLFRLVYAMLVAEGRKVDMGELESADASGYSLLVPMAMLDRLMAQGMPQMLDEEEAMGLWHLAQALSFAGRDGIETDEIANAIMDRRFFIVGDKVRMDLYMHTRGGVVITTKEIAEWRRGLVLAVASMAAFRVMLVASTIGENGQIHPEMMGMR